MTGKTRSGRRYAIPFKPYGVKPGKPGKPGKPAEPAKPAEPVKQITYEEWLKKNREQRVEAGLMSPTQKNQINRLPRVSFSTHNPRRNAEAARVADTYVERMRLGTGGGKKITKSTKNTKNTKSTKGSKGTKGSNKK